MKKYGTCIELQTVQSDTRRRYEMKNGRRITGKILRGRKRWILSKIENYWRYARCDKFLLNKEIWKLLCNLCSYFIFFVFEGYLQRMGQNTGGGETMTIFLEVWQVHVVISVPPSYVHRWTLASPRQRENLVSPLLWISMLLYSILHFPHHNHNIRVFVGVCLMRGAQWSESGTFIFCLYEIDFSQSCGFSPLESGC